MPKCYVHTYYIIIVNLDFNEEDEEDPFEIDLPKVDVPVDVPVEVPVEVPIEVPIW